MSIQDISRNVPQTLANNLEYKPCGSLKALVVGVCAVAIAALGFWVAGLAGLAVGAIAGAVLGFATVWLNSLGQEQDRLGKDLVIPDRGEYSLQDEEVDQPGDWLAIKDIQWMTGTQSIMLSFMLASHRQTNLSSLEAPALVPQKLMGERQITPLTSNTLHPDVIIGTRYLNRAIKQTFSDLRRDFTQDALDNIWFKSSECDLITNPFPIIFASSKELNARIREEIITESVLRNGPIISDYRLVEARITLLDVDRPLLLGQNRDIQIIYTAKENIARVKAALGLLAEEVDVLAVENQYLF